ncbi:MAG: formate dehydrogenase accessory sulfurtransferase FdhD [Candidatus Omnitrophica bacterium]|nr:formate dehydrogenase accessory sulfurtransferase FdhD [Candidatus Omnitrophota bacterium]MCM8802245.1 formate dehydrogenase accessory sulfurtransferase FdhD [Candidatus Omnitrophota bacterium]
MIINKEILRYKNGEIQKIVDKIVDEIYLRIFVNNRELIILGILPEKIEYFVYGFLFTNGIIKNLSEIKSLKLSGNLCFVEIENPLVDEFLQSMKNLNSGCGSAYISFKKEGKIENKLKILSEKILYLKNNFEKMSKIYKETGSVHSCGLSDHENIIIFAEDISRHNAFDKVIGEGLFKNLNFEDKILLTSGRITSDITTKCVKVKIPVIVSISAPTYYALKIAEFYNITLIGFARGNRFNIYTCNWRVI